MAELEPKPIKPKDVDISPEARGHYIQQRVFSWVLQYTHMGEIRSLKSSFTVAGVTCGCGFMQMKNNSQFMWIKEYEKYSTKEQTEESLKSLNKAFSDFKSYARSCGAGAVIATLSPTSDDSIMLKLGFKKILEFQNNNYPSNHLQKVYILIIEK